MRVRRLDLIRYGHFTDKSFELPVGKADFHIVFGPNEAGKSTALSAIEDLLFGIPTKSPYGFLHDYTSMRIGALVEDGSSTLEVLRRKGNKDTLLGSDGLPVVGGESVLRPYLAGADRSFFERMFSLDHIRLQAGGREILDAKDDLGQTLFSAGAGIAGLRDRLTELSSEADELWSARRAKHRQFYVADDKLKEADRELRDLTLTANKWRELKRDYDAADEAFADIDAAFKEISAERNRLSRIRRVYRDVRRKRELDSLLEGLDDVVALPEDASDVLEAAERKGSETNTRIATLTGQIDQARTELEGLTFDAELVRRADDVRQLHERRIEIRGEKADLPKREAELDAAEEELNDFASELGWEDADTAALIERVPPRTSVSVVRSLLNEKGEIDADVTNNERLLRESADALNGLKERLAETGNLTDVSELAIVIRTVREQGDITGRVQGAETLVKEAQGRVDHRLPSLHPAVADGKELTEMHVPARAQVQNHLDLAQDASRRLRETQQQAAATQQELDSAAAAFERSVRDEQVVTVEELKEARSRREALWNLVKLKHVLGSPIPAEEQGDFEEELKDLTAAFEPAMSEADALADRRFDHAEEAGRLAELNRTIGEHETLLEQIVKKEAKLSEELDRLQNEWLAMWREAPIAPLEPDAMLEWLDARDEVLDSLEERAEAEIGLEASRTEENEAREGLIAELAKLGIDGVTLETVALPVVLERAAEEQRLRESETQNKAQLEEAVHSAANDMKRREQDLISAKEAQSTWQDKWTTALGELGLVADVAAEAVGAQIEVIDQMRDKAGRINTLRHDRIEKINRDVADFEKVVAELVRVVAENLADQPADEAVLEIEKRLAAAERLQGLQEKKQEEIENLTKQVADLEDANRQSAASIVHLLQAAGVETHAALKEAIDRSDQRRTLENERATTIDKLQQDGDGLPADELEKECDGIDIDEVAAREVSIETELADLQQQQADAVEARSIAREAFQAIGGDDAAARAAADRQEALAEMRETAERYVRVKTSAMLLQWAIDRYRREKQAPMLKRAGELFTLVTGRSFAGLRVEFDEQDQAHLTGQRPDGTIVPVSGMSTGTADQLYLALRVASIEDYLERADALPFVADDLFINFDDDRAAAGFRVLGQLAETTQVLFFTHHQHLVDIAQSTLGSSVHVAQVASET